MSSTRRSKVDRAQVVELLVFNPRVQYAKRGPRTGWDIGLFSRHATCFSFARVEAVSIPGLVHVEGRDLDGARKIRARFRHRSPCPPPRSYNISIPRKVLTGVLARPVQVHLTRREQGMSLRPPTTRQRDQ